MPPVNLRVHFSEDEIKWLRRIAETAPDLRRGAIIDVLAKDLGIDRTSMVNFQMRLYPLKLATGSSTERFYVTPLLVESLHALDNAPPVNRWEQFKTWFNSRWWSVPFYIIVVGLPALVGYVTMLTTLLDWFGFGKSGR